MDGTISSEAFASDETVYGFREALQRFVGQALTPETVTRIKCFAEEWLLEHSYGYWDVVVEYNADRSFKGFKLEPWVPKAYLIGDDE